MINEPWTFKREWWKIKKKTEEKKKNYEKLTLKASEESKYEE